VAGRLFGIETMLRIHFMQQWFNLSDPAMEEALHDMPLFRDFAGLGGWGAPARREHHPALSAPAGEAQAGRRDASDGQRLAAGSKGLMLKPARWWTPR
jgi:hypothetical protein